MTYKEPDVYELSLNSSSNANSSLNVDPLDLCLKCDGSHDPLEGEDHQDYGYTNNDAKINAPDSDEDIDQPNSLEEITTFLDNYDNKSYHAKAAKHVASKESDITTSASQIAKNYPSLKQKPLEGPFVLTCKTAPEYKDRCAKMLRRTAAFYNFNSRGKANMYYADRKPRGVPGRTVRVNPKRKHSSAGNLGQFLLSVSIHELGHQIGFGHAKLLWRVKCNKKRCPKGQLLDTVMNGKAMMKTKFLNTPEYFHKDWLEPTEYAIFDFPKGAKKDYVLYRTNDFSNRELKAVIIPHEVWSTPNPKSKKQSEQLRPLFFSWPTDGFCSKGKDKCVRTYVKAGGGVLGGRILDKTNSVSEDFRGFKLKFSETDSPNTVGLSVERLEDQATASVSSLKR